MEDKGEVHLSNPVVSPLIFLPEGYSHCCSSLHLLVYTSRYCYTASGLTNLTYNNITNSNLTRSLLVCNRLSFFLRNCNTSLYNDERVEKREWAETPLPSVYLYDKADHD